MTETESKDYQRLKQTYRTLSEGQQPLSIHRFMLPYIGTHIFGLKNLSVNISPQTKDYLKATYHKENQSQQQGHQQTESELITDQFEIGEKEQRSEQRSLNMKSLVSNVGSIFNAFMTKKR